MAKNGFVTQAEADDAKAKPIQLADTAYYQSQHKSSPFDYPVEFIRQELEDKYTTRVAQGGLAVYTSINVDAQKRAYEVLRGGLRNYDRSHTGWRSSYTMIPTSVNNGEGPANTAELNSYKHPDWYGNDYETGRHLMGLIMKVDRARNEATARFGNFTATVTPADMGWGKRQPQSEFKAGHLAEFEIKEVDEKNRRLKVDRARNEATARFGNFTATVTPADMGWGKRQPQSEVAET